MVISSLISNFRTSIHSRFPDIASVPTVDMTLSRKRPSPTGIVSIRFDGCSGLSGFVDRDYLQMVARERIDGLVHLSSCTDCVGKDLGYLCTVSKSDREAEC